MLFTALRLAQICNSLLKTQRLYLSIESPYSAGYAMFSRKLKLKCLKKNINKCFECYCNKRLFTFYFYLWTHTKAPIIMGSVNFDVIKSIEMNAKNGPSGLKELGTESLETNNKKQTSKVTQTSTSRKINSSRNILLDIFTPTKRKLMETKTVKNLILKFES